MNKRKIAIVGMSCRFPGGVSGPEEFWRVLEAERDAVTQVPADRFGTAFYSHPSKSEPGKSYTFAAGVLDDIAGFDAGFFGISPREATQMDPQQRLLLELTWEAFEHAGIVPRDMRGRNCGVYIGVAGTDYANRSMDDLNSVDPYSATGNTLSIASNRISYLFDLRGPSLSIDTACSSSLVALHQAVSALQSGEVETALAGGVNLLMHPFGFVGFSKASMLSPRGRCRAFDASGDGYVRAEGGAVVVLKPLDRALADGDVIHAVIEGTGVNSDGYSPGGISVPGAVTQAALLRTVYARAEIDPLTLDYVEAHGTGTAVGDPIEARALIEVAGAGRSADAPLLIGSVKTNIGHLETASGMAGLFKAVLCLKHRAVPRTLHFEQPNPNIDFEGGRLRVVDRLTPIGEDGHRLVIGVNSFGFGGTNAHVALGEGPRAAPQGGDGREPRVQASASRSSTLHIPSHRVHVRAIGDADDVAGDVAAPALAPLVLSARSRAALAALAAEYEARLAAGVSWHALASAAAHRRQWLEQRAIVAPSDLDDAHAGLIALASPDGDSASVVRGEIIETDSRLALVFSGNGAQWAGMAQRLIVEDPLFRAAVDDVDAFWCADGSPSLRAALEAGVDADAIAATEHAQPLLFAIQVGIVRALEARGVAFEACVGHSVGEVAAAWAAHALTLRDAVHVVKERSRAQAMTRGRGRMAAAGIGEAQARELVARLDLAHDIEIAGVNSPESVTLAGSLAGLHAIRDALRAHGTFFQVLELDYAFHSRQMDTVESTIRERLADLAPRDGERRFVSTVTGATLVGSALDARYWWRNIREPVRFGDAIARLVDDGVRMFVEIGPHSILRTYVKQSLDALKVQGTALATLKRQQDSAATLQRAILSAIAHGAPVDRTRFVASAGNSAATLTASALPRYPWQREPYLVVPTAEGYGLTHRHRVHPLLGYRLPEHAWAWENQIDPVRLPFLADHIVDGGVTFPGAGFVEMALAAATAFFGTETCALEHVEIRQPVVFQASHAKRFRLTIDARTAAFTIETRDRMSEDPWATNVVGRLLASGTTLEAREERVSSETLMRLRASPVLDADTLYARTEMIGLRYGPAFRRMRVVHATRDAALGEFVDVAELDAALSLASTSTSTSTSSAEDRSIYRLHPALMDAGFHPLFALLANDASETDRAAYVPVQIARIDYLRGDAIERVLATVNRRSPHSIVASFDFLDARGRVVARLGACRFRRVDLLSRRYVAPARYAYRLEARPLADGFDATPLPAMSVLLADASRVLAETDPHARRTMHLTEVLPLLDVLASAYALRAFDATGAFDAPALHGPHADRVARLARMLVEDGLARWDGSRLVRESEACDAWPDADALWRSVLELSPAHVAELTLLAQGGASLPALWQVPRGPETTVSATHRSLVEHYFDASPTWSHARALAGAFAARAVEAWRAPRRLRVLEIVPADIDVPQPLDIALPAARCDRALACTAQQHAALAAEDPDIGRFVAIGLSERSTLTIDDATPYDIVIADRLLARQRDPLAVLSAVRGWLAPGAYLVLAESRHSRFADIAFASHEVTDAMYSTAHLVRVLEEAGFDDITPVAEQGLELEGTPALVIARAPARVASPASPMLSMASMSLDDAASSAAPWLLVPADKDADAFAAALAAALRERDSDAEVAIVARDVVSEVLDAAASAHERTSRPRLVFVAPETMLRADAEGADLMRAQHATSISLARRVREIDGVRAQIHIVTRDGAPFAFEPVARDVHDEHNERKAPARRPEQATLWGLGRVLANEHPAFDWRLIDVASAHDCAAQALAAELLAADVEEEVVLAPSGRFVPRLFDADEARRRAPASTHAVLAFDAPGSLRNLEWFAPPARMPADDEVEIEPVATGLNFRDVMYAMGLLSDEAVETGFAGATVGMEFSGRVTRVGARVTAFAPGDAVLGFAPASFATRAWTRATAIAHKPASMTFEEAATIPTTFFTVWYALVELARVRRGERVLVHGGAGGVGVAAIQLARHLGAQVFATAGSDEKREFVRLLGADRVFDSRSLGFADAIREATGGAGVDIVLNSLAGEAMVRSIDTLRPFGRFLELGKRDFYENTAIGLRPFRNNISYFGIDADQLMGALPELTTRLFADVMQAFEDGALHPLPYRVFAARRVKQAFRYMQQARQIGKVLVGYASGVPAPTRGRASQNVLTLDARGAYLVVGGTGGLGFATARRMIERGARDVTLASRGATLVDSAHEELARWRTQFGARVDVVSCDVTDGVAVDALVASIAARGALLKGVLHSAMHIDDGLVRNLDDARFEAVLEPKVAGAWNLHRATIGHALDFFIVYSSATTAFGNPGQSSYVAANSFVEALVEMRRAAGLPGTAMAWGPLDDVGFLARHAKTRDALQTRIGGASISSQEALDALERVLLAGEAGETVVRLDWQALARGMPAAHARRYASIRSHAADEAPSDGAHRARDCIRTLPRHEALAFVETTLRMQIARILHLAPERVERDHALLDMGMDSLMGMELGMAVEERFEVKLSVMAIAEGVSVRSLAERIVDSVASVEADEAGAVGDALPARDAAIAQLASAHALDREQSTRARGAAGVALSVDQTEAVE
ncbi:type I polyketide synthase [Pararobbsia silviterrae]|uniref:SDR family NAD(P)-dependent oxidoreductase n=1 Tax=Pararobbsia silviterrae TaxID=1792498 RepID=A0A494XAA1_9BURK|nr:type I polyketide synthase [Pararobbsia silviterrae]RKP47737.1 SDR family NAD(P)-dependent oxidoreductase [Pararobbsia silviterrae]